MYYLANSGRTLVILRVWNKKCPEWAPHVCGDGALTVSGHSRYNPAYAGILLFAPHPVWRLWIQPRVCGDTCQIDARVMRPSDTTPRMRGYFTKHPPTRAFLRYNPAYAGILWAASLRDMSVQIQPRVCGDTADRAQDAGPRYDTTPRMRGY